MKKILCLLLAVLLLAGCSAQEAPQTEPSGAVTEAPAEVPTEAATPPATEVPGEAGDIYSVATDYVSRFDAETVITLSDEGITVNGGAETETVYTSRDIIYYEARESYDSGNPYGEGTGADKHTLQEAQGHTVVNITAPGAYRVTGSLSAGQLRIDLGEDAYEDPQAVVELILQDADITCTVAPAILFLNTYECDGDWSVETAKPDVDTASAGANLILQGENTVSDSYVAKIYRDAEGEKKLWKQDGAIYSYQSLNVYGPGALELTAANEGLDSELHLSLFGGSIVIRSQNDGINTNEDGVSVTTIHGGDLRILAGLGQEGDGIDSNGYLVINGGTVAAAACSTSGDAGIDSDMGIYINGGTVLASGNMLDQIAGGDQTYAVFTFAQTQSGGTTYTLKNADGNQVISHTPVNDFSILIIAGDGLAAGDYTFWQGDTQLSATSGQGFGGRMGGGQMPDREMPEDMEFPEADMGERPEMPGGEEMTPPKGMEDGQKPQDREMPEGELPTGEMIEGERPQGGFGGRGDRGQMGGSMGESSTTFTISPGANYFSNVTVATQ